MLNAFLNYTNNFDLDNNRLLGKVEHTKRVANNSIRIAKSLGLSEKEISLAETVGYLHDIGRFEQLKRYNTFIDKFSIDHANLGVKILFEENLIDNFQIAKENYKTIEFAIKNHNKLSIEESIDKEALLQAKIIRDADKIDIFKRLVVEDDLLIEEQGDNLTKEVKEAILNKESVNYKYVTTRTDAIFCYIGFIFDLYFIESLKMIEEMHVLEKIRNLLPKNREYIKILDDVNKYLDERMK